MMHSEINLPPNHLQRFSITKIIKFLHALKQLKFSGKLIWTNSDGHEWTLFFNLGQIIYGTGGIHPVRRWQRNLLSCCPEIKLESKNLDYELANSGNLMLTGCWEYQLLYFWMKQQELTEQEVAQVIQDIIAEILFDVTQTVDVTHQLQRYSPIAAEFVLIRLNEESTFTAVQLLWQAWLDAHLENYSPNLAPVVRKPEQIRASTSPPTYQMLTTLLNGQQTLRDLAAKTHRDILQLAQGLQSYVELNWIELIHIPDYPAPTIPAQPQKIAASNSDSPLIACIDDSKVVCHSMERVIRAAGYQFVAIMEAPRAIATLLAKKPDIIFLDLIMPETNGYEICSQLRKVSLFKETPIIILSGNDGIVDQVRARLLGATDFVSKPMEPAIILNLIRKHLEQIALA